MLQLEAPVTMHQRSSVAPVLLIVTFTAAATVEAQQQAGMSPAARIELSTSSDKARAEYQLILLNGHNLRGPRALEHARNAIAADPSFGLAKVHAARYNAALTAEQRTAEINRAIAEMSAASAPEIMLALAYREFAAGRTESARAVIYALADIVPGDPDVQFIAYSNRRVTAAPNTQEQIRLDREFIARFPDYAAAYNTHAYSLFASGDRAGALATAMKYMQLAPDIPNSHDTYGDLLLRDGKYDDAVTHAQVAIRLDSSWAQGYNMIGAIRMRSGAGAEARTWFKRAMDAAATPAAKLEAHHWIATTYVVERDLRNALRELDLQRAEAEEWSLTAGTRALTHMRLALVEAYLGNKANVAGHVDRAAQIGGANNINQHLQTALVYSGVGDAARVRAAADGYAASTGASPNTSRLLSALAAVTARDFAKAEGELAQITVSNLLADELRAEVAKERGRKAEAAAAKAEFLSRPVKSDNTSTADAFKVVARLRAGRL